MSEPTRHDLVTRSKTTRLNNFFMHKSKLKNLHIILKVRLDPTRPAENPNCEPSVIFPGGSGGGNILEGGFSVIFCLSVHLKADVKFYSKTVKHNFKKMDPPPPKKLFWGMLLLTRTVKPGNKIKYIKISACSWQISPCEHLVKRNRKREYTQPCRSRM
jgi:hypothetical protein